MHKTVASDLNTTIDHTLLKPDAITEDIDALCRQALEWSFAAVCINPCWVLHAAHALERSSIRVATVAGFPLGASTSLIKAAEAREAALAGAVEIDMVQNVGMAKSGRWDALQHDIAAVVDAAGEHDAVVKVILECGLLDDSEKLESARRAVEGGAGFVKTSTGIMAGGATVHDVALLRKAVGDHAGVKASGGIRTLGQARAMLSAGADRLGTSSGVAIAREALS